MTPTGPGQVGRAVLAETGDFVTGEEAETRELGAEQSSWLENGNWKLAGKEAGGRGRGQLNRNKEASARRPRQRGVTAKRA